VVLAITIYIIVYVQDHIGRSLAYSICTGATLVAKLVTQQERYRYERSPPGLR
jgi:hypothetical protein